MSLHAGNTSGGSANAPMPANTVKGNNSGVPATPFNLTVSDINTMTGNSGDVSLTAVGATPSANGASLSSQALTLQPADGTHPGLLTSGVQTIGGAKTFSAAISASNLSGTNTGDQTITLSSEASGSGTGSVSVTLANSAVIGKVLTGYVSGAGTVAAADSILGAIQKLNGNDALKAVATRNIATTSPLSGGGDLSADRTLSLTTVPANLGGTGVANNAAATTTRSGNFAKTETLSGTTSVTYPTAGTLATLAGNEVFTNKTLTLPIISSISNTGTVTLPTSGTLSTLAGTEAFTNKDIDGGTASNTSRLTLPQNSLTNFSGLTRKTATIGYNTTSKNIVLDDGTNLFEVVEKWNTTRTFTPSGFGTLAASSFRSKRIFDTLYVRGTFKCGTVAGTTAKISLPVTIDSTQYPATATERVGYLTQVRTAAGPTNDSIEFIIFYDGSDTAAVYITFQTGSNVFTKVNGSAVIATSDNASVEFMVAVSGW